MSILQQSAPLNAWLERFAGLLQSAAGAAPEIRQAALSDLPDNDPTFLWRRYATDPPKGTAWIGAAQSCRRVLAEIVLGPAAPQYEPAVSDAYIRLLDQSWDSHGMTDQPSPAMRFYSVEITFPVGEPLDLLLGFDDSAATGLTASGKGQSTARDVLLSIELPLTVRFGRVQTPLAALIGMNAGSLINFDRTLDEQVEILVNGRVVARGEAVTVQGNYGVRILEVASRRDLLDTSASVAPSRPPGNDFS